MHIGMVVPVTGFAGGIERHAHDLAVALSARGHRVRLIPRATGGRDVDRYRAPFADVRPLSSHRAADGLDVAYVHKAATLDELASLDGVPLLLAAHDHDLTCVRSHRYLPFSHTPCHRAPGVACVGHGCVLVRNRDPDSAMPVTLRNPFALRTRLRALTDRAPIVACSRYVRDELVSAGAPADRVHVVHPIPPEDTAPPTPRPRTRTLLALGQLLRGKGFDIAIDALRWLPADTLLAIVGDGPHRGALESLAAPYGSRVVFPGYVPPEGLAAHYDAAAAVVVPSRWPEPFGMTGIESMRRARPVIAAAHGGIPEWLGEDSGGALVAPCDSRALAEGIARVLDDPLAGRRAHAYAVAHFSHTATVDAIESLLMGRCAGGSR